MASTRHCFFGTIGEEGCRGLHVSVQLCFTLLEAAIKGSELQLERVAAATGGWLPDYSRPWTLSDHPKAAADYHLPANESSVRNIDSQRRLVGSMGIANVLNDGKRQQV